MKKPNQPFYFMAAAQLVQIYGERANTLREFRRPSIASPIARFSSIPFRL